MKCPYCKGTGRLDRPLPYRDIRLASGTSLKQAALALRMTSGNLSALEHGTYTTKIPQRVKDYYVTLLSK